MFDQMQKRAESEASRTLVTASNQYGITTGSYTAEYLELTSEGRVATADDVAPRDQLHARFRLAIENNTWFRRLYESHRDSRLPVRSVLADELREGGLDAEFINECVETFTVNAKYLGMLRTLAGAERLLSLEHRLDEIETEGQPEAIQEPVPAAESAVIDAVAARIMRATEETSAAVPLEKVCFYITPIGSDDSEYRQHSDLFMSSLVEPAVQEFGLKLVRADHIGKPGLITAQVIQHIVQCPLVIADLSFHNPNVFYELALRHAVRKPIVQIIRKADRIPFDLQQFRTIEVDTTSIYTLVPRLDTYRAEIASQIRTALESPHEGGNPLTYFYPNFWSSMPVSADYQAVPERVRSN